MSVSLQRLLSNGHPTRHVTWSSTLGAHRYANGILLPRSAEHKLCVFCVNACVNMWLYVHMNVCLCVSKDRAPLCEYASLCVRISVYMRTSHCALVDCVCVCVCDRQSSHQVYPSLCTTLTCVTIALPANREKTELGDGLRPEYSRNATEKHFGHFLSQSGRRSTAGMLQRSISASFWHKVAAGV
jgi:hypothetical protein